MKAGREMLRLPVDVPAARLSGSALDELEQAVARTDIPAAVGLEENGWPRAADAGIDNTEKDGSHRKPCGIGRQQIRRCLRIADRRIGEEVDHGDARRHLVQHRFHLARIRAVQPEIREQRIMVSARSLRRRRSHVSQRRCWSA